ncbi:MAG: hypothetical protein HQL35_08695 [Alphaproteobacteria bacterium]|nr:hypothetical protein [Alphaproteobacteria bacterium]
MPEIKTCPECGETFTCDPQGDCWCKHVPTVKIPDHLKGQGCLCRCVLDRLLAEQTADDKTNPS